MAKSVMWLISGAVYASCLELAKHARIPTSAYSGEQSSSEAEEQYTEQHLSHICTTARLLILQTRLTLPKKHFVGLCKSLKYQHGLHLACSSRSDIAVKNLISDPSSSSSCPLSSVQKLTSARLCLGGPGFCT